MSESLRTLAFLASALLWAAVGVAWVAEAGILGRLRQDWRICPPLRRALAVLAIAAAVAYAGGKGEGAGGEGVSSKEQVVSADGSSSVVAVNGTEKEGNDHTYSLLLTPSSLPHHSLLPAPSSLDSATYSLTDGDISRGYRLVSVATNEAHSYEMPPDARLVGTWHLTDAYDAVAKVFLEGVSSKEKGVSAEGKVASSKEKGVSAEDSSSVVAADGTQQDVAHHTYSLLLPPSSLSHHSLLLPPSSLSFSFPLGGQVVTSLWAHVWGKARPQLGNASNELVAVGAPMFARRGVSHLWTAATTNGSVLLTWQNFFLEGVSSKEQVVSADGSSEEVVSSKEKGVSVDGSSSVVAVDGSQLDVAHHTCSLLPTPSSLSSVSAQLELFRDGSFVAWSNSVARVYRRVNPDDWDGDGIPNDEDDDPRVAADEPRFGPRQSLPPGAHTNNYFWVDLVVRDADALVTFVGDAPSNLPDPSFVARAGETNRVTLLIGKAYAVRCRMPFGIVGKSDAEVEVGADEDGRPTVCRPVRCEIVAASAASPLSAAPRRAATGGRRLRFTPEPVGADVTWNANYCCLEPSAFPSGVPLYNCDGSCGCGGCAVGTYTCRFEGFELSFPDWPCGCSHVSPDEPHRPGEKDPEESHGAFASASFSASVILFEDEYEDAPGVAVPWRSTEAEAEFAVGGGPGGASYRLELRDGGRLVRTGGSYLPREGTLGPGETFRVKVRYGGRSASGAVSDIVARATVTEEGGEGPVVSEATLTAVQVLMSPFVEAPENDCPWRHRYGVGEQVDCRVRPTGVAVSWRASDGGEMRNGDCFVCPLEAAVNPLEVSVEGVAYTPAIHVVEPSGVQAFNLGWSTYGLPIGNAGGIGLEADVRIHPLDVSFQGISVEEVPSTVGFQSGYFTHSHFDGDRCHSRENGAGVWHRVTAENAVDARDTAAYTQAYPRMAEDGRLTEASSAGWIAGENVWSIPFGWSAFGTDGETEPFKCFASEETQTFTIDAAGTAGVRKFRHEAVREVLGSVYLDGVKVW